MKKILILVVLFATNVYSQGFLGTSFLLEKGKAMSNSTKIGVSYDFRGSSIISGVEFYYGLGSSTYKDIEEEVEKDKIIEKEILVRLHLGYKILSLKRYNLPVNICIDGGLRYSYYKYKYDFKEYSDGSIPIPDLDLKLGAEYILRDNIIFKLELGKGYRFFAFKDKFNILKVGVSFKI
ncbi:MAG: hypothetical protein KGV44_04805 [Flavobacteriaceae bacterium]|nr:hypothetical protein [Flavobacteriaceae bacterium]